MASGRVVRGNKERRSVARCSRRGLADLVHLPRSRWIDFSDLSCEIQRHNIAKNSGPLGCTPLRIHAGFSCQKSRAKKIETGEAG